MKILIPELNTFFQNGNLDGKNLFLKNKQTNT